MISFSKNLNPSYFDQISNCNDWQSPKLDKQKQSKNKVSNSLVSFWKKKSKDTDFIEDLKKQTILSSLIRYDTKFNNKRKVEFESSLAGVIRIHPRMLQAPVIKVAKAIAQDLIFSFEKAISYPEEKQNWLHQHLYSFFSENSDIMAEYTGEYGTKISSELEERKNLFYGCIINYLA